MPLQPFRCLNEDCSESLHAPEFNFAAESPTCPKCNSPAKVIKLTPVHYLVNDTTGLIRTANGTRKIVCKPTVRRMSADNVCSGERLAVTCPDCRETAVFKAHDAADVDQDLRLIQQKTPNPNAPPPGEEAN